MVNRHLFYFLLGCLIYFVIFLPINYGLMPLPLKNYEIIFQIIFTFLILILNGYHIISEGFLDTIYNSKKNKKFTPNVHILMALSALGSVILRNFNEAIILIIIFSGANFLEEYIDNRSKKEITKLLQMIPIKARLLKNNQSIELVDVKNLKINDCLLVLNGDQIPSDGIILSGSSTINESNLTGENIPVEKKTGDYVFSNTINITNSFTMKVTTNSEDTVFAKIISLLNQTQTNISRKATLIKKIEPIYVKFVLGIILIISFIGFILCSFGQSHYSFESLFYKVLIFLTVASPCALAVSDIPVTLSAISHLTKKRILIKGGRILENFADLKNITFDKTGTLTQGLPVVQDFIFIEKNSLYKKQQYCDILLAIEKKSNHPLAFAIKDYLENNFQNNIVNLETKNLIGIGMEAFYNSQHYLIAKADSFTNIPSCIKKQTEQMLVTGKTVIYFSCNQKIILLITISDLTRSYAKKVIDYFSKKNINTCIITGDNESTAVTLQKTLNIKEVFYNALPQQKAEIIIFLKKKYGMTAMVGDGVNDAPALLNADISLTTKEGTDIAIDVSDIVLLKNNLKDIIYVHQVCLKLKKILWQNIFFSLFIICLLIIINFASIGLELWMAVILHELSTILVILNSLRMLYKIN